MHVIVHAFGSLAAGTFLEIRVKNVQDDMQCFMSSCTFLALMVQVADCRGSFVLEARLLCGR